MKTLDFNVVKKSTFPVVLKDKEKTKLTLICPTKEISDAMKIFNAPKESEEEAFECYYQTTALILSRNSEGVTLKASDIQEMGMDLEDMNMLIFHYDQFAAEIFSAKN